MFSNDFIPFHRPSIGESEIAAVAHVLRSGWLTSGPQAAAFENAFRRYVGAPCALAANSGTAALHLALAAMGIGPGDEVITTPLTFCSTVITIMHVGATPVLADIGPDGNIATDSIAERITPRTRALVPVHLGGFPCDMERIWSIARGRGISVIEDAAHAVGTLYKGSPIGAGHVDTAAHSDAVAFSFYVTKNLTTGEGGMVTTHDPELLEHMRRLCLHGISKDAWNRYSESGKWFYEVLEPGFKYNLTDIQAALGLVQLERQETFIAARTRYAETYNRAFADCPELELPPECPGSRPCWHLYVLRLNLDRLSIDRNRFIAELRDSGIGASVHFIPIPLQPFFKEFAGRAENWCPRALDLYPRLISLPLYPALAEDQVRRIADTVIAIVRRFRKTRAVAMATAAGREQA